MPAENVTVTVSDKIVSIIPVGGWTPKDTYEVTVGSVTGSSGLSWSGGTYTFTVSDALYMENFDSYAAGKLTITNGKVYDSKGTLIAGATASVTGDDYYEIVEENGTKYLKIYTKHNTKSSPRTGIRFNFGETLSSGTKEVSYKYKSIAHSVSFLRMGTLYTNESSYVSQYIKFFASHGDNIAEKINVPIFGWTSDLAAANYKNGFATITQTVNYGSNENNYKVDLKNGTTSRTKTYSISNISTKAALGINWDFSYENTIKVNGKDAAIDGYGIYAIDEILVKDIKLELESTNAANNSTIFTDTPFALTFAEAVSAPGVTVKKNGTAIPAGDVTVTVSDKTVSIIPVGGWKADATYEVSVGKVTANSGLSWDGATYTLIGDDSLFLENFEGYATGRLTIENSKVYDSKGTLIAGAKASVTGDDYFEIVEEDGNKFLKIYTKKNAVSSPRTGIRFNFGETLSSGTNEVSYKYKSIAHNVSFLRMGTLYRDEASYVSTYIKAILSQGDNIVTKLNETMYGWTNDLSAANYTNGFGTITHTVNYGSDENNYKVDLKNGTTSRTKTYSISNISTKAAVGINWDFSAKNDINVDGKDEAIDGYGVYAIDDVKVKKIKLDLTSANVTNGQVISVNKKVEFNFSGAVADDVENYVTVSKNGEAMSSDEYSVMLSDSNSTIVVSPKAGAWDFDSNYQISIAKFNGAGEFAGTQISFTTEEMKKIVLSDNFEDISDELETKVVGPATLTIGNIKVQLQEGDSIEYAYDDETNQYGLKLTKSGTNGTLVFDYLFPETYTDGKYRVKVSEKIENHSKAHDRWPALLKDSETELGRAIYGAGYWLGKTGKFNSTDRFGVHWGNEDNSRWISGYTLNKNNVIWGELTCGLGYKYGTYDAATNDYSSSVEPATDATTLSGVRLRINENGDAPNYEIGYIKGSQKDDDTVNNPNNDGIAWVYGVTVERVFLEIKSTSFVNNDENFPVDGAIEIAMTEKVDESSVTPETVVVLKDGIRLDDIQYSVNVSEDKDEIIVDVEGGLEYDADYSINLSKNIRAYDQPVGRLLADATFALHTETYVETKAPNIVSSTIDEGADNVSYKTEYVILSTDDVLIDNSTITAENIKVYKNDVLDDSYTVAANGNYSIKVSFNGLDKNAYYRIVVDGLVSGGTNPTAMSKAFVLNFETVDDIYVNGIALDKTDVENKYNFGAVINNNSDEAETYQPVLAIKEKSGKLIKVIFGEENTVSVQETISIQNVDVDLENAYCELFVWKDLLGIEPIVDKKQINNVKIGKTVAFSPDTNVILVDGEAVVEEILIEKDENGFIVPAALASKYIVNTDKDLSLDDIRNLGIGVYESEDYNFVVIGDEVKLNDTKAQETVAKFGIYVSPNGSDENAGYASAPVATLQKAVEIYEAGTEQPILVHAGTYRISETVNLTSKSNGMTIKDFGDGEVIISGAVELPSTEFAEVSDSETLNKIPESARAYVKEINLGDYIADDMIAYPQYRPQYASTAYYELFAGDNAQTIARWPNEGFKTTGLAYSNSFMVDSDKAKLWKNAENGMIAGYFKYDWAFENIYINKSSGFGSFITLAQAPVYGLESGQRYYAMNMLEELDVPGEYYIDNSSKILYYYPVDNFASVNPEISVMTGDMVTITKASDVKITGITFEKTRGKGIVTSGGKNISIDNCVLRNIGNNAVSLSSSNSELVNSDIYAIGGPGVIVNAGSNEALTNGNVLVKNNTINNFGRLFRTYQGAIHINGCGNIAEYNTIYDAPHCAVRFSGSKHTIKNNEIYDVVEETSDAGAIYAGRSWTGWGNVISNNYLHGIKDNVNSASKVNAVYIDDLLGGTTVENNLIVDCESAALFGGGRGNVFSNNLVVNCEMGVKYDARGEDNAASMVKPDDSSSDNVFETFVKFLGNSKVQNTMTERRNNFVGFGTLVDDVNAYLADSSYKEVAYPKDATITNNYFYGSTVGQDNYLEIYDRVKTYGTYSDNVTSTDVPEYSIPDCGANN